MKRCFLWLVLFSLFHVFVAAVSANWQLYDDFNSGNLDLTKWSANGSSGSISVENGKAKFVHAKGHPNESLYLHIAQHGSAIMGIKATVTVASCTGDVRARIAGHLGFLEDHNLWTGIHVQPGENQIFNSIALEHPQTNDVPYDLHWSNYEKPIDLMGRELKLMMLFSNDKTMFEVEGLGKFTVRHRETIPSSDSHFRALGTRSTLGQGPCTVYYDNVYIYLP